MKTLIYKIGYAIGYVCMALFIYALAMMLIGLYTGEIYIKP